MQRVDGIEIALHKVKKIDSKAIISYDAIVFGGPTHFGEPRRSIKKFIDKLSSVPSVSYTHLTLPTNREV